MMRLRVIYADLSEWHGTSAAWGAVRHDILFVQVEHSPGHWATLQGFDHYVVDGDLFGGYNDWTIWRGTEHWVRDDPPPKLRALLHAIRHGVLADNDVWERARVMARNLPDVLR